MLQSLLSFVTSSASAFYCLLRKMFFFSLFTSLVIVFINFFLNQIKNLFNFIHDPCTLFFINFLGLPEALTLFFTTLAIGFYGKKLLSFSINVSNC